MQHHSQTKLLEPFVFQGQFHVITDIENDSIAQQVGLEDGEVLLAVCGNDVRKDAHGACVSKIKYA